MKTEIEKNERKKPTEIQFSSFLEVEKKLAEMDTR
jgi:hypothetical protein